jgi:hypothetical protein
MSTINACVYFIAKEKKSKKVIYLKTKMAAVMVKSHCNSSSRFDWSLFLKKKRNSRKMSVFKIITTIYRTFIK